MPSRLLFFALLLSLPASGQSPGMRDLLHARSYGMAGAFRALGLGGEALGGNPAALSLFKTYRVELTGAWDVENKGAFGGFTVVDSSTSHIAAGVGYQLVSLGRGEQRRTAHLNTLGLSFPLSSSVLLGASGRYLLMRGPADANAVTADVGALIRPSPAVALGFSGHNLIDTRHAELSRYYSGHLGLFLGLLTVAGDVRADFAPEDGTALVFSGGLEYILGQAVPVRVGYAYDETLDASQLGVGLGFITQGGGLDLAYRHDFGGLGGRLVAITLRFQVR